MLGGSFDPVHAGHLHAARAALEAFALDRVVFVPAAEPPHKIGTRLAPGADRLAMLALALRGEPRFAASGIELERGGRSYTIDTVRALRTEVGEPAESELYLIVGSDNVPGLPQWRDARTLLELVHPVVIQRDGPWPDPSSASTAPARAPVQQEAVQLAERLLDAVALQLGPAAAAKLRAGWLHLPPVRVSSTGLRAEMPRLGAEAAANGLDPAVLAYIRAHGLYGTRA
jgi:nicotinate-nucleotide adenylyltransferase